MTTPDLGSATSFTAEPNHGNILILVTQTYPSFSLTPDNHRFVWSFCMVVFFRRIGLGIHFFYDLTPASSCGLVHVLEGTGP